MVEEKQAVAMAVQEGWGYFHPEALEKEEYRSLQEEDELRQEKLCHLGAEALEPEECLLRQMARPKGCQGPVPYQ